VCVYTHLLEVGEGCVADKEDVIQDKAFSGVLYVRVWCQYRNRRARGNPRAYLWRHNNFEKSF
jgi:hypothetical protein